MKHTVREILYLVLSIFFLWKLVLFSFITPLPHSVLSFLIILFLAFLAIVFFKGFKLERYKNCMKNAQKIAKNYSKEKEAVNTIMDIIYDNLSKDTKNALALIVNYDEDYIVDFIYNLKKFSKYNGIDINELSKFQIGACLIDALSSSTVWIFQSPNKDDDSLKQLATINTKLAISAGLLVCGFTLEDIENNQACTSYIEILIFEAIIYNSLGNIMLISIISDFLEAFCE